MPADCGPLAPPGGQAVVQPDVFDQQAWCARDDLVVGDAAAHLVVDHVEGLAVGQDPFHLQPACVVGVGRFQKPADGHCLHPVGVVVGEGPRVPAALSDGRQPTGAGDEGVGILAS